MTVIKQARTHPEAPRRLSMAEMYFERFTDSLRHGDRVLKL